MTRLRRSAELDEGMTLIEVLVAMSLLLIVSALVLSAVVTGSRAFVATDDEARGLADVKTVAERLDRDVRNARGVVCDGAALVDGTPDAACHSHLQLWVDLNSNYKLDAAETITWQLKPLADGNHYEVVRTIGTTSKVQATSLVVNFAFDYNTAPTSSYTTSHTTSVTTGMTYDALYGVGTSSRTLNFITRLRNVA